jgi:hypothetical protein
VDNFSLSRCFQSDPRASGLQRSNALASVQTPTFPTRTFRLDGTKIASLFLQAQLLLFSQNHFGNAQSRHRVKVFSEVIGAVRGVYETQISSTVSSSSFGYSSCRSLQYVAGGGNQPGNGPRIRRK